MRSILMTVMMLIVVALLFVSIINDNGTGIRAKIKVHGDTANTDIASLSPGSN